MAIVPNKDGMGIVGVGVVDKNYSTPNRAVTGVPVAASQYANEIVVDTATADCYRAMTTGGTVWIDVHEDM